MTQTERVLEALARAGARGITQVDFLRYPTADGGPPITRVAARVEELRDQGYCIVSGERRDKCVVYRLQPEKQLEPPMDEHLEPNALFDLEPRNAIFDEEQAA